jgi:hypothetical protein
MDKQTCYDPKISALVCLKMPPNESSREAQLQQEHFYMQPSLEHLQDTMYCIKSPVTSQRQFLYIL